jgi:hypothetical protein
MDQKTIQLLDDIKKLLILALTKQDVQGKRIADVLNVDPAIISRILASKNKQKKVKK